MKRIAVISFAVLSFALFALSSPSSANAQAYRGLVIDEVRYVLDYQPRGTVITKTFHVTHDFEQHDKRVELYLKARDFTSDGKTGAPVFLPPDELPRSASLAQWITFDRDYLVLDHYGQVEPITFTITIPQDAEVGGYYAAVFLGDREGEEAIDYEDDKVQLGLNKELGPLVLLSTDGELRSEITSDELFTQDIRGKKRSFFFNLPVTVVARLKNTGNVHEIPKGRIFLYKGDDFNDYEISYELNEDEGYILPDTTREFSFDWTEGFLVREKTCKSVTDCDYSWKINWSKIGKIRIGTYNVKLMYSYESENGTAQTYEENISFFVFPWWLLIVIAIILGYIILRIVLKKNKKKNGKK